MITSHQKASKITDEGFSIHTLCLTKTITYSIYNFIFKNELQFAKGASPSFYPLGEDKLVWYSKRLSKQGIRLFLIKNKANIPMLKIIVNPASVIGEYDSLRIFNYTQVNLDKFSTNINHLLEQIHSFLTFETMTLSRIDLSANVILYCISEKDEYLRLIQKNLIPITYQKDSFDESFKNYDESNKHSFRISNGERIITIYDKIFQVKNENLFCADQIENYTGIGLLRFEVSLLRNQIVDHLDFMSKPFSNIDAFKFFCEASKNIMQKEFFKIFGTSWYCKRKKAQQIVDNAYIECQISKKMKNRLLQLIEATISDENVNSALAGIQTKNKPWSDKIKRNVLDIFQRLNLNPVTIRSKESFFLCLPSIAYLLETETEVQAGTTSA